MTNTVSYYFFLLPETFQINLSKTAHILLRALWLFLYVIIKISGITA